MVTILWTMVVRRLAPRQLDAFAGRGGRPDWPVMLRRGLSQGVLGGSNRWLVFGGVAALVQVWRKVGRDREAVLLVQHLIRDQGISIFDTGVERRKGRK